LLLAATGGVSFVPDVSLLTVDTVPRDGL